MKKKLRQIVSLSLVIILLTPLTTQHFDAFFHHHEHIVLSNTKDNHFQVYHEKCPISNFQLSIFSLQQTITESEKTNYPDQLIIHFCSDYYSDNSRYSFLLRAPPIQTEFM